MRCADARLVCSTDALVAVMHRTCLCATRSNHLSVGHLAQLIFSVHLTLSVVVSKRYKARRHKLHRSDRMRTPTKTQSDARDLAQLAAMVLLRMTMLVPTLLDSPRASEVRVSCRGCSRQSVAFTIHVCYSTAACRVQQARFQCAHMNTQPRIASIGFNDRRFVFASQSSVFRNFNASPKHEPVVNVILSLSLSLSPPTAPRSQHHHHLRDYTIMVRLNLAVVALAAGALSASASASSSATPLRGVAPAGKCALSLLHVRLWWNTV